MKISGTIFEKYSFGSLLFYLLLVLAALACAFVIASAGVNSAYMFAGVFLGIAVVVTTFAYPVFGFYFCIFLSFFVFDIVRLMKTDLPLVSIIDFMVYCTFLSVLVHKISRKEAFWRYCRSPIVVMFVLGLAYTLIEIFNPNGASPELTVLILRRYLTLILFFYCAIQFFKDWKAIRRFIWIYTGLVLVASLYACFEQWHGLPKYELDYIQSDPLVEMLASLDNGDYRKASFLSDFTQFGLLTAAMSSILITFLLTLKARPRFKAAMLTTLVVVLLAMSYTGTRTAVFVITIDIVLYILLNFSNRRTFLFTCCAIVMFVGLIYGPFYGNATLNRVRTTFLFSHDESMNVRDVNRHRIQPYIYSHPIGGGLGTTGVLNLKYNAGHPLAGFPTDSGLLKFALEYGWIGLLIECATYFVFLQQGIRYTFRSRNPKYKSVAMAATIGLFGYVVAQYSQVAIYQVPGAFLFFGLIAVIIRLPQIERFERAEGTLDTIPL